MNFPSRNQTFYWTDGSKMKYTCRVEFYDKMTGKPSHWRHELSRYDENDWHIDGGWVTAYKAVTNTKTFPFTPDNLKRYEVNND
jgi:hypothetical protein